MWYIILSAIILVCFVLIYRIAKNKIKVIDKTKIETTIEEKQAKIKKRLLESKLEKKFLNLGQSFLDLSNKGFSKLQGLNKQVKRKKKTIKFKVDKTAKAAKKKTEPGDESAVQAKLLEAQVLFKKRQIDEAEDKFIEVLDLDHKNIEAYMGLGEIYGMRKDWQTAEEAYRYIVKIKPKFFKGYKKLAELFKQAKKWDELKNLSEEILKLNHEESWVYVMFGLSYKKTGYPDKAEVYFKRAVEIEPRNEKLLDYLLEVAIINKNKVLAQKAFNTLSSVCKDEIKVQDYRNKIEIL